MSVEITHRGTTVQVNIRGELTIYSVAEVKEHLALAMQQGEDVVVNLAEVTDVDTAGLQLLLLARCRPGWRVSYVQHSPEVLRLLLLSDMGRLLGDPLAMAAGDLVH